MILLPYSFLQYLHLFLDVCELVTCLLLVSRWFWRENTHQLVIDLLTLPSHKNDAYDKSVSVGFISNNACVGYVHCHFHIMHL